MTSVDLTSEFPHSAGLCYLNHAAVSPWPARTAQAVARFADENLRFGAQFYPQWLAVERRLREQLAGLIGARTPDEIALLKNTSEGLSLIAQGLNWNAGDNIVIPSQEFPSNRIVWQALEPRGVLVKCVDIRNTDDPEAALLEHIDSNTRLLSVSSVQYDNGYRLDLGRLGKACEQAEVFFVVDAIQSLGVLPLNVRHIRADFVVADGHKWLLGPEGLALFYCRRELFDLLQLRQFGWHMVEHHGDFDRIDWEPAHTARRFECGSPNMLGIHALSASLSLFDELGVDHCAERILANTEFLIQWFSDRTSQFELMTTSDPERYAGIVSFKSKRIAAPELHTKLMDHKIICALRGGAIRFSPHFYTPRSLLEQALEVLDD